VTGNERDARAIIVDNKEKQQDLYQIGDAVQGAFIESIERGMVTLDVNGRKEALLIKDREGGGPGAPRVSPSASRLVPEAKPEKRVTRRAPKARPHRRISFRQDPELPEVEPEIIEDEDPAALDQDQGPGQLDDTAVDEGPPPVE
jgi:type II secretory pathway component PulC